MITRYLRKESPMKNDQAEENPTIMADLQRQIRELQQQMKVPCDPNLLAEWDSEIASPFIPRIANVIVATNSDKPRLNLYDGSSDPLEFLRTYRHAMVIRNTSDATMCKAFSAYLKKYANNWYNRLRPNSIESFHELGKEFVAYFVNSQPEKKPADTLLTLKQGRDKTLRRFIGRFNTELHQINEPNFDMVRAALRHVIRDRDMKVALNVNSPRDLQELMATADWYINNKESLAMEKELKCTRGSEKRKDDFRSGPNHQQARHNDHQSRRAPNPHPERVNYTPLNTTVSNILYEIQNKEPIHWPERMRNAGKGRNSSK
ncbi:uncharacterized protein LOC143857064 [Tasmannia lanceolata]|uniref:uncharacterized protein LOC143857064 n=1 Tax=Tasmannia lanceolata TaxID=3420 RepID=UPI004063894B